MTIAIIGAGAVGSLIGGLLSRNGNKVTLVGRQQHVDAINASGLHINGVGGDFTVAVHAATACTFTPDLVIIAVKTPDMEDACRSIAPFVHNVPVCTLQNGVRSDAIAARFFGKEHIIGGIVMFNARHLNPGQVTWGSRGTLTIGNVYQPDDTEVIKIAELLNTVIPTIISNNIYGARWSKLLWNIFGNTIDALTGNSLQRCMATEETRLLATLILKEALFIIEKADITLAPLPVIDIDKLAQSIKAPPPDAANRLQTLASSIDTMSSTLQSLKRRKLTEIDFLNGEIVNLGQTMNIATPYNSKVVELIREIEKTHTFFTPERLKEAFSAVSSIEKE